MYSHYCDPDSAWGHYGVRIFFLLSGLLITSILLRPSAQEPHRKLINFYARRTLRIFPAYYVLAAILAFESADVRAVFGYVVTYLVNFYFAFHATWEPWQVVHLWTLSVEEQFYLLFAPFFIYVRRSLAVPILAVCVVAAPVFRWVVFGLAPDVAPYVLLPSSLDALAGGALLAVFAKHLERFPDAGLIAIMLLFPAIIFLMGFVSERNDVAVEDFLELLPFSALLLYAARGRAGPLGTLLGNPVMVSMGRISYGLYLYHLLPVSILVRVSEHFGLGSVFEKPGPALFAAAMPATVLIAACSWFAFERWCNSLKVKFPN